MRTVLPKVVRGPGAPGRRRRPPRRPWERSWREVPLAAVAVVEEAGEGGPRLRVGLAPIESGRVVVGRALRGALEGDPVGEEGWRAGVGPVRAALRGSVPVTWSVAREGELLRRAVGGGRRQWSRGSIDVRALVAVLEGLRAGSEALSPPAEDPSGLLETARRYRVPHDGLSDPLDRALAVAQLLLVVATKLEAHGRGSVRDLLRASRGAGPARSG